MELITMSKQEITRLEVLQRVSERRLSQTEAAKTLNLSLRQTQRLWASYRQYGAQGITSKKIVMKWTRPPY